MCQPLFTTLNKPLMCMVLGFPLVNSNIPHGSAFAEAVLFPNHTSLGLIISVNLRSNDLSSEN